MKKSNSQRPELRVPPQDIGAEQALLCACLIRPEIVPQLQAVLSPSDFYRESHRFIIEAMFSMGKGTEFVSLGSKLAEMGRLEQIGGVGYLAEIMDIVSTSVPWRTWAETVKDRSTRRHIILSCHETAERAYHEPTEEVISSLKGTIATIERDQQPEIEDNLQVVNRVFKDIEKRAESKNRFVGIRTGFKNIDDNLCGMEPKTTTYLIARPSMGKTALGLCIADWVAFHEGKTLFFSLESNKDALTRRRLAAHSGVFLSRIRTGHVEGKQWDDLVDASNKLSQNNLLIVDTPRFKTVEALTSIAETVHMTHGLKLIVIDHIQLMRARKSFGSRHQEISSISDQLQSLAKTCNVPILILCQLSREVEKRPPDKQYPQLSDMKESGDLEQNADNVWGLWRVNKESERARVEQLKGRDTGTWHTWLRFDPLIQRFYDVPGAICKVWEPKKPVKGKDKDTLQ